MLREDSRWVNLFDGTVQGNATQGGNVTIASPIGTPPAFVKKGGTWEKSIRDALIAAGVAQ